MPSWRGTLGYLSLRRLRASVRCESVSTASIRSSVVTSTRAQGREMLGVPEDATLLVVFGGSLGAQHVNEAVCRLKTYVAFQ